MENIVEAPNGANASADWEVICEERVKRLIYLSDLTDKHKPARLDTPSSVGGLTCLQLLNLINHSKYSVYLDFEVLGKKPDWSIKVDESLSL